MRSIRKVLLVAALTGIFTACGGGDAGGTCSFDIDSFTNGTDAVTVSSVWDCTSSNSSYTFAFYADGTGYSSALGAFTWQEIL